MCLTTVPSTLNRMELTTVTIHDKPNINTSYIIVEVDGSTLGVSPNLQGDLDEGVDDSIWHVYRPYQCAVVPEQASWEGAGNKQEGEEE